MGGSVPGARRISPASQSEPAGIRSERTDALPRAGRPAWSRHKSSPVRRRRLTTARVKLGRADPRKAAQSERRPQSSSRLPCPRSGDACRAGKRKLAVCNTLCAASDPSPGSPSSVTRGGDGEGRSRKSRPGPTLEARTSFYGTEDPMLPGHPSEGPAATTRKNTGWERAYKHAPNTTPTQIPCILSIHVSRRGHATYPWD